MSSADIEKNCSWGSRRTYVMALLCQTIGTPIFVTLPVVAIERGATGYIIAFVLAFIFVGIPLLYMEFIVSQFTARDCLDVWKARAFLSHVGYVHIFWQLFLIIYNHTLISFAVHYFLISFEDPIPYYTCGTWSKKSCNIVSLNYTIYKECVILNDYTLPYCENLYKTYPEYQYWRYFILGGDEDYYYVAWRVCLASGLACAVVYLSCFKRKKSMKVVIVFLTSYPTVGYFVLMIGSMMQKGLVVMYEEALDLDMSIFVKRYRVSNIIQQIVYALNIGTGISFNLGSSASFHAPCYSNIVITVVVCALFSALAVCTIAMMSCPYAYEHGTQPSFIMHAPLSLIFEKMPKLLKEFDHKSFWLILAFSSNAVIALSTNVIVVLSLLDMFAARYSTIDKYPGLVTFATIIIIFFVTTPLLGNIGVYAIFDFKRIATFINIFIAMIESLVFVVWYGLHKFSEDVHFMQGVQPKTLMKLSWVSSSVVLAYVFCNELIHNYSEPWSNGAIVGWWTLGSVVGMIIVVAILKLIVAAFKKKFQEMVRICPTWGPRSEVLVRSRAMFSAQAMTKEYIYRQYHLQAGILARQNTSNVRRRDIL